MKQHRYLPAEALEFGAGKALGCLRSLGQKLVFFLLGVGSQRHLCRLKSEM